MDTPKFSIRNYTAIFATLLALAVTASDSVSANTCLWVALAFAVIAGAFSISRTSGVNNTRPSGN